LKAREVIELRQVNGWQLVRVSDSHHHFAKEGERNLITVPIHARGRDVPPGLLRSIVKAARIEEQQ